MKKQEQLFLLPNPKHPLIRDPLTRQFLAAEGEFKPKNTYWLRRVKFEDVIVGEPPKPKTKVKPRKEKGDPQ
jgi:hypothetical protein